LKLGREFLQCRENFRSTKRCLNKTLLGLGLVIVVIGWSRLRCDTKTTLLYPSLHQTTLHWLPVRERVTFKTAVLVCKCLHDVAPRYLVDLCVPSTAATAGRRQSRSAVSGALMVPWTRTSTGQRSFAVYVPRTWNRLPPALRLPELSLSSFRRQLKTHLFQH